MKKQKRLMRSFRLHPDTITKLVKLSHKLGKSQAKLIEEAVDKIK